MRHPLHKAMGEFVRSLNITGTLCARECGGNQNLPCFYGETLGNDTEFCNPDILMIADERVNVIIEIEESGLTPIKLAGKLFAPVLSTHFIHDILNRTPTRFAESVAFIQVVDSKTLPEGTSKFRQGTHLEVAINGLLPLRHIKTYRLFFFRGDEGFKSDEAKRCEFETAIRTGMSAEPSVLP